MRWKNDNRSYKSINNTKFSISVMFSSTFWNVKKCFRTKHTVGKSFDYALTFDRLTFLFKRQPPLPNTDNLWNKMCSFFKCLTKTQLYFVLWIHELFYFAYRYNFGYIVIHEGRCKINRISNVVNCTIRVTRISDRKTVLTYTTITVLKKRIHFRYKKLKFRRAFN